MRNLFIILSVILTVQLSATIVNIPADYETIQAGLEVASTGDTIMVDSGIYYENIIWPNTEDLKLIGRSENECILNGNYQSNVLILNGSFNSTTTISNFTIKNGMAIGEDSNGKGGGIYLSESSSPTLRNIIIKNNTAVIGGGIYCHYSDFLMENVSIHNNTAIQLGGGIFYRSSSGSLFSPEYLCSIYSNNIENERGYGADIYSRWSYAMEVIVDTFTVMNPTDYHASPMEDFLFSIQNSVEDELINADLYVSVSGNDSNTGTSPENPLKTIKHALEIIYADLLNINTIHLAPGIYSPSTNSEQFPIHWSSYVNLSGAGQEFTVVDADSTYGVFNFNYVSNSIIEDITITGGNGFSFSSETGSGGGIVLHNSSPVIRRVTITDNIGIQGGAVHCCEHSSPIFENVLIADNTGSTGGAICCLVDSEATLINVTLYGNGAYSGGAIYLGQTSEVILSNSILWHNTPEEIYFQSSTWSGGQLTVSYSDIENGEAGIVVDDNSILNWMNGNFDEDPIFVNEETKKYHLQSGSPCIDAGDPNSPFDNDGTIADMGAFYYDQGTEIEENFELESLYYSLDNHPNPFNPSTTIKFSLHNYSEVNLTIYNIKGQKIKTLINSEIDKGNQSINWNGDDKNNEPVTSGVYLYKLDVNGKTEAMKKCLLLK